jgi:hypothetical protein
MHAVSHKPWFKAICLVLVVSFICLDISWAQPANVSEVPQKLSAELPFQTEIMDEGKEAFRNSLFSDIKLLASIETIAKYLLEEKQPLKHMQSVITEEIGDIAEGIDLSRVTVRDNIVSIPMERNSEKSVVQIAMKDGLSPEEAPSAEWIESGRYIIRKVASSRRSDASPNENTELRGENMPERKDKHDLTARSCIRATWVSGSLTLATVIGFLAAHMIYGLANGMILLAEVFVLFEMYVVIYYLIMGLDIRDSLMEYGVPKEEAMDTPIASSNGFLHKAYSSMALTHQYAVLRHEIYPHIIGMLLIPNLAKIFYPIYFLRLRRFERLMSQYMGVYNDNPESMYEYAQLEFPQIRAFAIERAWKLEDIDKIGRLFVLAYGRDDELAEPAVQKLFNSGNPAKIKEYVKKCLMGFTDSLFYVVEVKAIIPRRCVSNTISEELADELMKHVNTLADFEKVVALTDYHYEDYSPHFKTLEAMAKRPGEIDKLFLGERIFARFSKIRRPGEASVDPKYERGASYRLARAAAQLYGTSDLTSGELDDVIMAAREMVAFRKARTPAYKFVDELAADPMGLRRSIKAQGGLFREGRSEQVEAAAVETQFNVPVNNTRTKFIEACNDMVAILAGRTGIMKELYGQETTAEITELAEQLLKDLDKLRTGGRTPLLFTEEVEKVEDVLRNNLRTVEAEGIIASIITLARQAKREGRRFIIGVETDWIPGIDGATMQHMAINPLVTELKSLDKTLKSMGLDNVVIVHDKRDYLAHNILWETSKTEGASANYSNVLVLASAETIASKAFDPLRSTEKERKAFLAGIDATLIRAATGLEDNFYEQLRVRLVEMFSLALELASGKMAPDIPMIKEYNADLRTVIFLPQAEPMDFKELQRLYRNQQIALQAA